MATTKEYFGVVTEITTEHNQVARQWCATCGAEIPGGRRHPEPWCPGYSAARAEQIATQSARMEAMYASRSR